MSSPGGFYPFNPRLGQEMQGEPGVTEVDRGFIAHLQLSAAQAAVADADGVANDLALPASGTTVFTTGITNPPFPRNLTMVGNEADIVGNVTVIGTNAADDQITEVFALNGVTPVVGNKAFKTVTSIEVPVQQDADETIDVGFGDKIGLAHKLAHDTVLMAFLNNVIEGTAPTVAVSASALESNTVDLDSALAGQVVDVYYIA